MSKINQESLLLTELTKYEKVTSTYQRVINLFITGATIQTLLIKFPLWSSDDIVYNMNNLSAKQLVDFIQIGPDLAFKARKEDDLIKFCF